jgi:hypothetical protein
MKKAFCFTALLVGVIFLAGTTAVADCPDQEVLCESIWGRPGDTKPFYYFKAGTCWQWKGMGCDYCQSLQDLASRCTRDQPFYCATDTCAACRTFWWIGAGDSWYDPRGACYDVRGWKYPNLSPL